MLDSINNYHFFWQLLVAAIFSVIVGFVSKTQWKNASRTIQTNTVLSPINSSFVALGILIAVTVTTFSSKKSTLNLDCDYSFAVSAIMVWLVVINLGVILNFMIAGKSDDEGKIIFSDSINTGVAISLNIMYALFFVGIVYFSIFILTEYDMGGDNKVKDNVIINKRVVTTGTKKSQLYDIIKRKNCVADGKNLVCKYNNNIYRFKFNQLDELLWIELVAK